MNKNAKRLLCLALCLMLVLSVLPMAAFAADTLRVYCQAPDSWTNCNAYWWGGDSGAPEWPGLAMTADSDGIWYYDIPADATNVIFNNGSTQTSNLDAPTGDEVMFVYATNTWAVYGKQDVVVADYYVAGSGALCGSDWNPSDLNNGLFDEDGDGIYTITYENVAAGSYELKVTDGSWSNSWGKDGGGDNYVLTIDNDGSTVEIRFDSATHLITSVIDGDEITETTAEPVPTGYYVAGTFNGWNEADANYLMDDNGDGTYTLSVFVTAGTQSLKVTDGSWNNAWGGTGEGGNYDLLVETDGVIDITFDSVNGVVTVTGDCLGEIVRDPLLINSIHAVGAAGLTGYEWDPSANEMTGEDGIYTITFTDIAAGTYEFKFVANGTWDINWATGAAMDSDVVYEAYLNASSNSSINLPVDCTAVTLTLDLTNMDIYTGAGVMCSVVVECVDAPIGPTLPVDPFDPVAYYVAGSFNEWNCAADGFQMVAGEDGIYTLDIDVTEGSHSLKVTDGTWDNSWGGEGGNYDILVITDGTITVTFDSVNYVVTVTGDCLGEIVRDPLVIDCIHAVGAAGLTGIEWDPTANEMTGKDGIYTITFTGIAAGTYEFKFAANKAWDLSWGSGTAMESDVACDAWVNGGNCSVTVAEDNSTVTLTLDTSAMDIYTGAGAMCSVSVSTAATGSATVSGAITSSNMAEGDVTVELWLEGAEAAAYTVTAADGVYTIEGVAAGSYTMTVSKYGHVTRSYSVTVGSEAVKQDAKICLIGDVSGDGQIRVGDVAKVYAHIKGNELTDAYALECADVSGDGKLNIGDTARIYAHMKGGKQLF